MFFIKSAINVNIVGDEAKIETTLTARMSAVCFVQYRLIAEALMSS
jgi:hypothetical protein